MLLCCAIRLFWRFDTREECDDILFGTFQSWDCLRIAVKQDETAVQDFLPDSGNCVQVEGQCCMFGLRYFVWISVIIVLLSRRWRRERQRGVVWGYHDRRVTGRPDSGRSGSSRPARSALVGARHGGKDG